METGTRSEGAGPLRSPEPSNSVPAPISSPPPVSDLSLFPDLKTAHKAPVISVDPVFEVASIASKILKELDYIIGTFGDVPEVCLTARERVENFFTVVQKFEDTPGRDPAKRAELDKALERSGLVLKQLEGEIAKITTTESPLDSGGRRSKLPARMTVWLTSYEGEISECSSDLADQTALLSVLLRSRSLNKERNKARKSQARKDDDEKNPKDVTSAKSQKQRWKALDFVPTVTFETPLSTLSKPRRPRREKRGAGTTKGESDADQGDEAENVEHGGSYPPAASLPPPSASVLDSGKCPFEKPPVTVRRMPYSLGTDRLEKIDLGAIKEELSEEEEEKLTEEMMSLYNILLPTREVDEQRQALKSRVEELLQKQWPEHDITAHLVGSSANLLGFDHSFMDICITTAWNGLKVCMISKVLAKNGMRNLVCIPKAKVPIARFQDPDSGLRCDVIINNTEALENTKLIRTFVDLDGRVRPLTMIIKYWTQRRMIDNAGLNGTLSPYTWTCIVFSFLQLRIPRILPPVWSEKYGGKERSSQPRTYGEWASMFSDFTTKNNDSIGELLFQFFRFVAHELDYDRFALSMGRGRLLLRSEMPYHHMINALCCEEPFTPTRNLGNTADEVSFRGIHLEMRRAFALIAAGSLDACCQQYMPQNDWTLSMKDPSRSSGSQGPVPNKQIWRTERNFELTISKLSESLSGAADLVSKSLKQLERILDLVCIKDADTNLTELIDPTKLAWKQAAGREVIRVLESTQETLRTVLANIRSPSVPYQVSYELIPLSRQCLDLARKLDKAVRQEDNPLRAVQDAENINLILGNACGYFADIQRYFQSLSPADVARFKSELLAIKGLPALQQFDQTAQGLQLPQQPSTAHSIPSHVPLEARPPTHVSHYAPLVPDPGLSPAPYVSPYSHLPNFAEMGAPFHAVAENLSMDPSTLSIPPLPLVQNVSDIRFGSFGEPLEASQGQTLPPTVPSGCPISLCFAPSSDHKNDIGVVSAWAEDTCRPGNLISSALVTKLGRYKKHYRQSPFTYAWTPELQESRGTLQILGIITLQWWVVDGENRFERSPTEFYLCHERPMKDYDVVLAREWMPLARSIFQKTSRGSRFDVQFRSEHSKAAEPSVLPHLSAKVDTSARMPAEESADRSLPIINIDSGDDSKSNLKEALTNSGTSSLRAYFLDPDGTFKFCDSIQVNWDSPVSYAFAETLRAEVHEILSLSADVEVPNVWVVGPDGFVKRPISMAYLLFSFPLNPKTPVAVEFAVLPGSPVQDQAAFVIGKPDIPRVLSTHALRHIAVDSLPTASSVNEVVHTQAYFLSPEMEFRVARDIDINMDMPDSYAYEILLASLGLKSMELPQVQLIPHPNGPIFPKSFASCILSFSRSIDKFQIVTFLVLPGEPPEGEPYFVLGKDAIGQCLGDDWTPEKIRQQQWEEISLAPFFSDQNSSRNLANPVSEKMRQQQQQHDFGLANFFSDHISPWNLVNPVSKSPGIPQLGGRLSPTAFSSVASSQGAFLSLAKETGGGPPATRSRAEQQQKMQKVTSQLDSDSVSVAPSYVRTVTDTVADSGYCSGPRDKQSIFSDNMSVAGSVPESEATEIESVKTHQEAPDKLAGQAVDYDDGYSDAGSLANREMEVTENFAEWLLATIHRELGDSELPFSDMAAVLPSLLREFAVRLGHEGQGSEHRKLMYVAHKSATHRAVSRLLQEQDPDRSTTGDQRSTSNGDHTVTHDSDDDDEDEDEGFELETSAKAKSEADRELAMNWKERITTLWNQPDPAQFPDHIEAQEAPMPPVFEPLVDPYDNYRKILKDAEASTWLLSTLHRHMSLRGGDTSSMDLVRRYVLESLRMMPLSVLPTKTRISPYRNPQTYQAHFKLKWHPMKFLEHEYSENSPSKELGDLLSRTITVTGDKLLAFQALTCEDYMAQTWPGTSDDLLQVIRKLVASPNERHRVDLKPYKGGSYLEACLVRGLLCISAKGTEFEIASAAEQLAWLGSALQRPTAVSLKRNYFNLCEPKLTHSFSGNDNAHLFDMRFLHSKLRPPESIDTSDPTSSLCWNGLFDQMVVAQGFPIPSRPDKMPGLEMPLDIAASIIGAKKVVQFKSRLLIKGFSSVLYPSKMDFEDGTIVWHLLDNEDESRISYADPRIGRGEIDDVDGLRYEDLKVARNIIGWCPKVENITGTTQANYTILSSNLPAPPRGWVLEKLQIVAGQYVTLGAEFARGKRIRSLKVSRDKNDLIARIEWLAGKHVIFHDTKEKRGWLVDGPSALLHLVRASIKADSRGYLNKKYTNALEKLREPVNRFTGRAASMEILTDGDNLRLELRDKVGGSGEDSKYRLQDRVTELLVVLEQMIDHQGDTASENGIGFKVSLAPWAQLEGFDFKDVARRSDPFDPKGIVLEKDAKGWVPFARSIHAITLFGEGFGDLLRPVVGNSALPPCPKCLGNSTAPPGRDILAVSMADLLFLHDDMPGWDESNTAPGERQVVHGFLWDRPAKCFGPCTCQTDGTAPPLARVQTFQSNEKWPAVGWSKKTPELDEGRVSYDGAVLLGIHQAVPQKTRGNSTGKVWGKLPTRHGSSLSVTSVGRGGGTLSAPTAVSFRSSTSFGSTGSQYATSSTSSVGSPSSTSWGLASTSSATEVSSDGGLASSQGDTSSGLGLTPQTSRSSQDQGNGNGTGNSNSKGKGMNPTAPPWIPSIARSPSIPSVMFGEAPKVQPSPSHATIVPRMGSTQGLAPIGGSSFPQLVATRSGSSALSDAGVGSSTTGVRSFGSRALGAFGRGRFRRKGGD